MVCRNERAKGNQNTFKGDNCQKSFYPLPKKCRLYMKNIGSQKFCPYNVDPYSEGVWCAIKQTGSHKSCVPERKWENLPSVSSPHYLHLEKIKKTKNKKKKNNKKKNKKKKNKPRIKLFWIHLKRSDTCNDKNDFERRRIFEMYKRKHFL